MKNVLFALADRRDAHHARCRDWLAVSDEPLLVPPTVLAEACYLIDKYLGPTAEAAFLDSIWYRARLPSPARGPGG